MKANIFLIGILLPLICPSCTDDGFGTSGYYTENPFEGYVDYSKELTLKETKGWEIDTLGTGLVWYKYRGFYQTQNAQQNVNVLELDLSSPEYQIEFVYSSSLDSLSNIAMAHDAIAGINGTYELDASFVKTNGTIHSQVTIENNHLRFWKHQGAVSYDGRGMLSIGYGTNESYAQSSMPNIFSGSPMLVDEFKPVGETFVGDLTGVDVNTLEGEDYRKHQSVRHPRTSVAITGGGKLLLMTVDGRRSETEGMSARELTQFYQTFFKPRAALNIDGGGSTTMWIKDKGNPVTNVVNYPTDNKVYDHYGQRRLRTFILIKKVSTEGTFAGGTGTEYDPYIIKTAKHLDNMHNLDWSQSATQPIYFKMEADVDMAGRMWKPLNSVSPYNRHLHFDGNGYLIKNLTSIGTDYASLFGVLCGSCKNLGVVNARIENQGRGVGIIAGYCGVKGPNAPTGTIDNCFTSGTVKAVDIVGGIAGNIGKENGKNFSAIRNSYSTATVTATDTKAQARAGGIVGIIWANGIMQNCYASGDIISESFGAGGLAGWSDANIISCVALNKSITNKGTGRIGRISGYMGKLSTIAQGENCWALENMDIWNLGNKVTEAELTTGILTKVGPYDGTSKDKAFLQTPANYASILKWKLSGTDQIWAGQFNSKGFPILKWMADRGQEVAQWDGHGN